MGKVDEYKKELEGMVMLTSPIMKPYEFARAIRTVLMDELEKLHSNQPLIHLLCEAARYGLLQAQLEDIAEEVMADPVELDKDLLRA